MKALSQTSAPGADRRTPGLPVFLPREYELLWQMSRSEKHAFLGLLELAPVKVAIEIGTYRGGSLQVLADRCEKVYSIDRNPACQKELAARFTNVEFRIGPSEEVLPSVLEDIANRGEQLGFVLVDGDHTAKGVNRDISNLLDVEPTVPLFIVCHDSFNPECRRGILEAPWSQNPWVHFVEIDYVSGVYFGRTQGGAVPRSMWGGFAVGRLSPQRRTGALVIGESQRDHFDLVYAGSYYSDAVSGRKAYKWLTKNVRLVLERILGRPLPY